jgi:hypothetical protein
MSKKTLIAGGAALAIVAASSYWVALAQESQPSAEQSLAQAREAAAALSARLQRQEDEDAVEKLQRQYGFFVDKALWKEAADLFTEDGTLEIGGRGVFVGKKRVLEYLIWLDPEGLTKGKLFEHQQLQPLVTIGPDGNTAQMRARFFGQVGEYQKDGIWGMGTYENEYVKENGVWKIKKLHAYFRMYTQYKDGWGKTALPNTKPEKDLPPDRPPTVVHEQYPSTFIPPYHYKHPVTGR